MEKSMEKRALSCMLDLYNQVLQDEAKYDPKITGSHVMKAFEGLSGILHKVSCDAMTRTQLSLFDHTETQL